MERGQAFCSSATDDRGGVERATGLSSRRSIVTGATIFFAEQASSFAPHTSGAILVVDDHVDTAAFLCRALKRHGYAADCCYDGAEAIARLKSTTPRLIVLDVQMPLMTGLEVLEVMHGDERLKHIPVIIYSAGHELSQQQAALQLGAKACVVKGAVGVPELMGLIDKHAGPARVA